MFANLVRVVEALGSAHDAAEVRPLATALGSRTPATPPGHA